MTSPGAAVDAPEMPEFNPVQVRRARTAVSVAFSFFGGLAGLWFVHIPVVAERLHLEPAPLGLALLCLGLGSLFFQPVAGMVLRRVGSKPAAMAFHIISLLMVTLAVNAVSPTMLAIVLFCTGASMGSLNVAINTQASQIELARGRPSMSAFHGFFSLGALVSAGLGGGIIAAGYGGGSGVIVTTLCAVPVVLWASSRDLPVAPVPPNKADSSNPEHAHGIARNLTPTLLAIMALAFIGNTVEFSVNDWSASTCTK